MCLCTLLKYFFHFVHLGQRIHSIFTTNCSQCLSHFKENCYWNCSSIISYILCSPLITSMLSFAFEHTSPVFFQENLFIFCSLNTLTLSISFLPRIPHKPVFNLVSTSCPLVHHFLICICLWRTFVTLVRM